MRPVAQEKLASYYVRAPSFYVMRLRRGTPLIPALIYQHCQMVMPQLSAVSGPNPEDWRRPGRAVRFGALIDGKPIAVDRVWVPTAGRPRRNHACRRGP